MITSFDFLNNLFKEIDTNISTKTKLFIIGGAALMYFKLKGFTKDIDLIVQTQEEYSDVIKTIKKIGFIDTVPTEGTYMFNISTTQERKDVRIDLFLEKVCGKLHLSNAMIKRAQSIFSGTNLSVFVCVKEDIFIFKSITSRDGDMQDCEELIKKGLDWKIILKEINYQVSKGSDIWITHINERLVNLDKKGFNIPILSETEKQTKKWYAENLEKKIINSN